MCVYLIKWHSNKHTTFVELCRTLIIGFMRCLLLLNFNLRNVLLITGTTKKTTMLKFSNCSKTFKDFKFHEIINWIIKCNIEPHRLHLIESENLKGNELSYVKYLINANFIIFIKLSPPCICAHKHLFYLQMPHTFSQFIVMCIVKKHECKFLLFFRFYQLKSHFFFPEVDKNIHPS